MKRGGPLRRKTPLARGKPLERKTGLARSAMKRVGKPLRRRPGRKIQDGPIPFAEFARLVYRYAEGRSQLSGEPIRNPTAVNFHHLIKREALRKAGLHQAINDPRNGILLTMEEHAAHESGLRRIPREKIPDYAWRYAAGLGPAWVSHLESRRYPPEHQEKEE